MDPKRVRRSVVPELPEVETIRRDVDREYTGRRIKSVEVSGQRSIRRHATPDEFIVRLVGHKISSVVRKGKYLLIKLDSGDVVVTHLGMSGQLLRAAVKAPLEKHTHVVISFSQGAQLRFVDPRTFGEMFVTRPERLEEEVPDLVHLGFDPLE